MGLLMKIMKTINRETTTVEKIDNGDFFILNDRTFKATERAQGYKRICVMIYDGREYALDRYIEVEKVI